MLLERGVELLKLAVRIEHDLADHEPAGNSAASAMVPPDRESRLRRSLKWCALGVVVEARRKRLTRGRLHREAERRLCANGRRHRESVRGTKPRLELQWADVRRRPRLSAADVITWIRF